MNKSRLGKILFVASCALCITVSSGICLYAGLNYGEMASVSFKVEENNKDYYLKEKVSFAKKDFIKYDSLDSLFVADDDMFGSYDNLVSTTLTAGTKFKKNDIIGFNGTENVVAYDDGMVLNISNSASGTTVDCYYFGKFKIQLQLSSSDFYSRDYKTDQFYADFNGVKKKISFDSYDYSQVENYGLFLVNYKCDTEDLIITESSFRGIFTADDYLKQAVYTSGVFSKINEHHLFAYKKSDGDWLVFGLYCKDIIGFCEIVEASYLGFDLLSVGEIYEID